MTPLVGCPHHLAFVALGYTDRETIALSSLKLHYALHILPISVCPADYFAQINELPTSAAIRRSHHLPHPKRALRCSSNQYLRVTWASQDAPHGEVLQLTSADICPVWPNVCARPEPTPST